MVIPTAVLAAKAAVSSQKRGSRRAMWLVTLRLRGGAGLLGSAATVLPSGSNPRSSGRRRSSRAWIGTVIAPRMAARASSAPRQPSCCSSQALSGMKMKLAKAPKEVSTVSARARCRRNQTATIWKAGSYSTAAETRPIPAMIR